MKDYIVIDNAFKDIDTIRDIALRQEYFETKNHPTDRSNFPGLRTTTIENFDEELSQHLINFQFNCISLFEEIKSIADIFVEYNMFNSFQYTLKKHDTWEHIDMPKGYKDFTHLYAGVLYLNAKSQLNSGTIINGSTIDYKYNRMVVYRCNTPHKVEKNFGTKIDNARLVLTQFMCFKVRQK